MVSSDCLEWMKYASMDVNAAQLLYSEEENNSE